MFFLYSRDIYAEIKFKKTLDEARWRKGKTRGDKETPRQEGVPLFWKYCKVWVKLVIHA